MSNWRGRPDFGRRRNPQERTSGDETGGGEEAAADPSIIGQPLTERGDAT